jgi:hypothetical protein
VIIRKYTGNGGKVVIPAEIEGIPVVELGGNSFYGEDADSIGPGYNITSATSPASVKKIGSCGAFHGCGELTSIIIQGTGVEIGTNAFMD